MPGHFLELLFFFFPDIPKFTFWIPLYKECPLPLAEHNDGPVAFRPPFPRAGNPLFDDTAAQVRIDLAFFCPRDGIPKHRGRDLFLPGKSLKPRVYENLQIR